MRDSLSIGILFSNKNTNILFCINFYYFKFGLIKNMLILYDKKSIYFFICIRKILSFSVIMLLKKKELNRCLRGSTRRPKLNFTSSDLRWRNKWDYNSTHRLFVFLWFEISKINSDLKNRFLKTLLIQEHDQFGSCKIHVCKYTTLFLDSNIAWNNTRNSSPVFPQK